VAWDDRGLGPVVVSEGQRGSGGPCGAAAVVSYFSRGGCSGGAIVESGYFGVVLECVHYWGCCSYGDRW